MPIPLRIRDADAAVIGCVLVFRDVTERKRQEDKLRASEERLRLAHEAAGIGSFEWNLATGVHTWTPELEAMYGLSPGGFARTKQAWENLLHPADRKDAIAAVDRALAGVRVLVVDDERDARDLVRRVLEERHAIVDLAGSAEEAEAAVARAVPDVILSDIGMPERDGYALMRSLRRLGVKAPAAALTAFARSEDRTRALNAGYQTHVAKPVEPAELLATVVSLAQKLGPAEGTQP